MIVSHYSIQYNQNIKNKGEYKNMDLSQEQLYDKALQTREFDTWTLENCP